MLVRIVPRKSEYHTQEQESRCLGSMDHRKNIAFSAYCEQLLAFILLHGEKVTMLLGVFRQRTEWGKPRQGESPKDRLKFVRSVNNLKKG